MTLPFYIDGQELLGAFSSVLGLLAGNEDIVFSAMATITASNSRTRFVPPTQKVEYDKKRVEIENILRSPRIVHGIDVTLRLMEEVYGQVHARGGLPGLPASSLLEAMSFKVRGGKARLRLTEKLHWTVEWQLKLYSPGAPVEDQIFCDVHRKDWGTIVPPYVVHYLHGGVTAYDDSMNDVAVALMSIAVEATLRDVLATRGYSFEHAASAVDIYAYSRAQVGVDPTGRGYAISFLDPLPKSTADFVATFGTTPVDVQVRRLLKEKSSSPPRIDIHMLVPVEMVDHWSALKVVAPARKSIGGLGAALNIARDQEKCVTEFDLAVDFDDVLRTVRNNLIHLSGDALRAKLPQFGRLSPTRDFTLDDFLQNHELVFDFMRTIPQFITSQYVRLRQSGHLST